ncbi:MAG: hypothetical protein NT013_28100 [Planctomycetia bacterium]|nr:hypothetical protein [Planctomycetia bacterium]
MKLHDQLLKDLKASAPKSAMLGLLLLIGLYFWVPPLVRAFGGSETTTATNAQPATASSAANVSTTATNSPADSRSLNERSNANTAINKKPRDSAAMARLLKESPLFQPASLEELPQKPFGVDAEQFPLPVLFADEEETSASKAIVVETKPVVDKLEGLLLKSTIVGARRRAALINNRLYQEGQSVPWKKQQLKLSLVQRKSVTLTDGSREWQLVLDEISESQDASSE